MYSRTVAGWNVVGFVWAVLALIHEEEKNIPGLFSFLHLLLFAIPLASTPVNDPFFPPRSQNGAV